MLSVAFAYAPSCESSEGANGARESHHTRSRNARDPACNPAQNLHSNRGPSTQLDAANWFEIPTNDLERATTFYEQLLGQSLRRDFFGEPMSLFASSQSGVGGALVHRELQQPSACGALVYLNCDSGLAAALDRMHAGKRGQVIVPITNVPGGFGTFAVIRDSEGNHVGLHQH